MNTVRSVYELKGRFLTHFKDIDCKILDIYQQMSTKLHWLITHTTTVICLYKVF